uniref:norbelladine synthase-like n=1 Tax=Erigeron canadensis TaxID=72917 RepID=UPI001CB997EA|nr:norbelladine synthase-like [Erigeron canadensis]
MFGTLSEVAEVMVPASKAWALYGTLEIAKLVSENIFENVQVIEGDGGTGTILKVTLKQNASGSNSKTFMEKFIMVDDENKVKVVEIVEGAYLDIGFTLYRVKIEIKENPKEDNKMTCSSCLVKITIEYKIKDEFAANASLVDTKRIVNILTLANEHLLKSN